MTEGPPGLQTPQGRTRQRRAPAGGYVSADGTRYRPGAFIPNEDAARPGVPVVRASGQTPASAEPLSAAEQITALIFPTGTLPYTTVMDTLNQGPRASRVSRRLELRTACRELHLAGKLHSTGLEGGMLTLPERRGEVLQEPSRRILEVLNTAPSVPLTTLKETLMPDNTQDRLPLQDFWDACTDLIDSGQVGVIGCRTLHGIVIGELHLSGHLAAAVARMEALVLAVIDRGVTSARQMEYQLEMNASALRWMLNDMVSRGTLIQTTRGAARSRKLGTYARPA